MVNPENFPTAPCIVDVGTVVNKRDMHRLLADLGRVRYLDIVDQQICRQGEGYVMEVYADPHCATLIANAALYLNVYSFDYLTLEVLTMEAVEESSDPTPQPVINLVQDNRILRILPLSNPLMDPPQSLADARALKAAMVDWAGQHPEEED